MLPDAAEMHGRQPQITGHSAGGPKAAGDLKVLRGEVGCGAESGREQAHTVCRSGSVWDAAPGDMKKTPRGESWEGEAWRVLGDGPRSERRSTCGGFQLPTLVELLLIIL